MLTQDQIEDWKKRWEEFPDEGHGFHKDAVGNPPRLFAVSNRLVSNTDEAVALFYRHHPTGYVHEVEADTEVGTWTVRWSAPR